MRNITDRVNFELNREMRSGVRRAIPRYSFEANYHIVSTHLYPIIVAIEEDSINSYV